MRMRVKILNSKILEWLTFRILKVTNVRGHTIFSKRYFDGSFCWNVILPNRHIVESSNYRNFIMPNDIFSNRCSAKSYFSESSYSRTSFSRNIIQPNVIFTKHHSAQRHFSEIWFVRTSFSRNYMVPNVISLNTAWSYKYSPCYLEDDELRINNSNNHNHVLIKCVERSAQCIFGKMTNRWNDVSETWCAPLPFLKLANFFSQMLLFQIQKFWKFVNFPMSKIVKFPLFTNSYNKISEIGQFRKLANFRNLKIWKTIEIPNIYNLIYYRIFCVFE